jgi:rod shape determining protein RodA
LKEFSVSIKDKAQRIDPVILICVIGMTLLSIITLSGGAAGGGKEFTSSRIMVQICTGFVGLVLMILISFIDYDALIQRFKYLIFAVAILLMAWVLMFGYGSLGNKNWVSVPGIPFNIQPSEFVKPLFIITFASHIDSVKAHINKFLNVVKLLIHAGVIMGMVLMTGDLGSVLVYAAVMLTMLFCAGLSLWYFAAAAAIAVAAFPILWEFMTTTQQSRILVGFNPDLDPSGFGYQPLISRSAIAAGGFRGSGYSGGTIYQSLPEAQSDFLFSVLAEKFGFFGCFVYIAFMSVLVIRLILIAKHARKDYGALICAGVAALCIFQSLENIGMCLAMLPVVGITLPFFSYGGSAMLSMYICMGVVQSVRSHNKKYYFEREDA